MEVKRLVLGERNKGKNPDFSNASHETERDSQDHVNTETTALWVDSHVHRFLLLFNNCNFTCVLFCFNVPSNSYLYTNREGYDFCFCFDGVGKGNVFKSISERIVNLKDDIFNELSGSYESVIFYEIHLPVDCINPHSQLREMICAQRQLTILAAFDCIIGSYVHVSSITSAKGIRKVILIQHSQW